MRSFRPSPWGRWFSVVLLLLGGASSFVFQATATEPPPALNPFESSSSKREDALPGYVELSDGTICAGQIYLTRDTRLKIADEQTQRQREIPLTQVKQIDAKVKKEWMEKEWKFKELTQDEKMYTGKTYPCREYLHTITLKDDRKITGGLACIVYVQPATDEKTDRDSSPTSPQKFLLNKRNKGEIGETLASLRYVKSIKLGPQALEEGLKKTPPP